MNRSFTLSRVAASVLVLTILVASNPLLVNAFGTTIMGGSYMLRGGSMVVGNLAAAPPPGDPIGTYTGTSFDTNFSGNSTPRGITWDGTHFWVVDISDDEVYKYTAAGTYTGTSFDTNASGNSTPLGITWDGTHFWVTDAINAEVYKYTAAGTYTGTSFDTNASGNSAPNGIIWDGNNFWITDVNNDEVYKYTVTGTYTGTSFDTAASGNTNPVGMAWDGTNFWITDLSTTDVYKYTAAGTYTGTSFDTNASGNGSPYGITWDGSHFWITDNADSEVYKYVGPVDVWGPPGTYAGKFAITGSGALQITSIGYDGTNLRLMDLDTSGFPNVQGSVYTHTTSGTYTGVNFDGKAATSGFILLGLATIGSDLWYGGINYDTFEFRLFKFTNANAYTGTSFVVDGPLVTWDGSRFRGISGTDVIKYTLAGANDGSFSLNAANSDPAGITWDGEYLWVADATDNEVYKYTSAGVYTGLSFDTAAAGITAVSASGLTYDGDYFYIIDIEVAEVYKFVAP